LSKGKRKRPTGPPGKRRGSSTPSWVTQDSETVRAQLPEEGQLFGIVVQILGASILLVNCVDGNMRQIRIPGRFRKRMWCRIGDLIILEPLYGMNPEEKGELVHRFRKNEVRWLVDNGYVSEDFASP